MNARIGYVNLYVHDPELEVAFFRDVEEGRVRPASEVIKRLRAKIDSMPDAV